MVSLKDQEKCTSVCVLCMCVCVFVCEKKKRQRKILDGGRTGPPLSLLTAPNILMSQQSHKFCSQRGDNLVYSSLAHTHTHTHTHTTKETKTHAHTHQKYTHTHTPQDLGGGGQRQINMDQFTLL